MNGPPNFTMKQHLSRVSRKYRHDIRRVKRQRWTQRNRRPIDTTRGAR